MLIRLGVTLGFGLWMLDSCAVSLCRVLEIPTWLVVVILPFELVYGFRFLRRLASR